MLLRIGHFTRYHYDEPVRLGPQTIRLRPREDPHHRLLEYSLGIDPDPAGRTFCLDAEGTAAETAWFEAPSDHLTLRSEAVVASLPRNPFDFVVTDPRILHLPVSYPPELAFVLSSALAGPASPEVARFSADLAGRAGETLGYLSLVCLEIFQRCRTLRRPEGPPHPPGHTLAVAEGSCRDLAVLFMAACRAQGIASRFVSGYHLGDPDSPPDLHAWAETYLPGAGWRGWDPSTGLAAAEEYVPVAASSLPSLAAPVSGTFGGPGAALLHYEITLEVLAP